LPRGCCGTEARIAVIEGDGNTDARNALAAVSYPHGESPVASARSDLEVRAGEVRFDKGAAATRGPFTTEVNTFWRKPKPSIQLSAATAGMVPSSLTFVCGVGMLVVDISSARSKPFCSENT
jgi:hypothetical protein